MYPLSSVDPYTKKDWYDVKVPTLFTNRNIGKTLVTKHKERVSVLV